jgi:hypothetical protein
VGAVVPSLLIASGAHTHAYALLSLARPRGNDQMQYRRKLAEQLQAAMAAVGMAHIDINTPVDALSGGYQRRLALALQLVRLPSLLLMDEPLAGALACSPTLTDPNLTLPPPTPHRYRDRNANRPLSPRTPSLPYPTLPPRTQPYCPKPHSNLPLTASYKRLVSQLAHCQKPAPQNALG